jgi:hypothetical protein
VARWFSTAVPEEEKVGHNFEIGTFPDKTAYFRLLRWSI